MQVMHMAILFALPVVVLLGGAILALMNELRRKVWRVHPKESQGCMQALGFLVAVVGVIVWVGGRDRGCHWEHPPGATH